MTKTQPTSSLRMMSLLEFPTIWALATGILTLQIQVEIGTIFRKISVELINMIYISFLVSVPSELPSWHSNFLTTECLCISSKHSLSISLFMHLMPQSCLFHVSFSPMKSKGIIKTPKRIKCTQLFKIYNIIL